MLMTFWNCRNTERLREKLEQETYQLYERQDQLLQELKSIKTDYRRLQKENSLLAEKLGREQRRAQAADEEKSSLYQALQVSIVKVKDVGVRSFPNGDSLQKFTCSSQERANDLCNNLADVLCEQNSNTAAAKLSPPTNSEYRMVMDDILKPCSLVAHKHVETFKVEKEQEYIKFLGPQYGSGEDAAPASLINLLWSSTMQKTTVRMLQQGNILAPGWWRPYCAEDSFPGLTWAMHDTITNHEDMEGQTVAEFMNSLVELYLYTRFSQPECFLYPPVGTVFRFNPSIHKQVYFETLRKKGRPGDMVVVLHPGLYFLHPYDHDMDQAVQPAVKPTVVLFPSLPEDEDDISL